MPQDDLASLENAVLQQGPRGAVLIGASVSPDKRYGATLTFLQSANYLMDDVFERGEHGWEQFTGGSGGGISWSLIDEDSERGVLRYGDEAPSDASVAIVSYQGQESRVPVRHGHFLFVAWQTSDDETPMLVGFE
ncbi:MAG TPA: hypothetical protein VFU26_07475 [Gaiellaceae bacterium]|nr:hypothetical protein [Gaiellaceae bacterium]